MLFLPWADTAFETGLKAAHQITLTIDKTVEIDKYIYLGRGRLGPRGKKHFPMIFYNFRNLRLPYFTCAVCRDGMSWLPTNLAMARVFARKYSGICLEGKEREGLFIWMLSTVSGIEGSLRRPLGGMHSVKARLLALGV